MEKEPVRTPRSLTHLSGLPEAARAAVRAILERHFPESAGNPDPAIPSWQLVTAAPHFSYSNRKRPVLFTHELVRAVAAALPRGSTTPLGIKDRDAVACLLLWPDLTHDPAREREIAGHRFGTEGNAIVIDGLPITSHPAQAKAAMADVERWANSARRRSSRAVVKLALALDPHSVIRHPNHLRRREGWSRLFSSVIELVRDKSQPLTLPWEEKRSQGVPRGSEAILEALRAQPGNPSAALMLRHPLAFSGEDTIEALQDLRELALQAARVWRLAIHPDVGDGIGATLPYQHPQVLELGSINSNRDHFWQVPSLAELLRACWPELEASGGVGVSYLSGGSPRRAALLQVGYRGAGKATRQAIAMSELHHRVSSRASVSTMIQLCGRERVDELARWAIERSASPRSDGRETDPLALMQIGADGLLARLAMGEGPGEHSPVRLLEDSILLARRLADHGRQLWKLADARFDFGRGPGSIERLDQLDQRLNARAGDGDIRLREAYRALCKQRGITDTPPEANVQLKPVDPAWECQVVVGGSSFAAVTACCSQELSRESEALHHCVRGSNYVSGAQSGQIALMLFRREQPGESTPGDGSCPPGWAPCFTVEVNLGRRRVEQARGKHNRRLEPEEQQALHAWASLAGISWEGDQAGADVGGLPGLAGQPAAEALILATPEGFVRASERWEAISALSDGSEAELRRECQRLAELQLAEEDRLEDEQSGQASLRARQHGHVVTQLAKLEAQASRILAQAYAPAVARLSLRRDVEVFSGVIVRHPRRDPAQPPLRLGQIYAESHGISWHQDEHGLTLSGVARRWRLVKRNGGILPAYDRYNVQCVHGGLRITSQLNSKERGAHRVKQTRWNTGDVHYSGLPDNLVQGLMQALTGEAQPAATLEDLVAWLRSDAARERGLRPRNPLATRLQLGPAREVGAQIAV